MCTFFLFILVSKLANHLSMGNKTSQTTSDGYISSDSAKNLRIHFSEEDYIPMPRSMRKSLINGRRFQHVLPSRTAPKDINNVRKEENLLQEEEYPLKTKKNPCENEKQNEVENKTSLHRKTVTIIDSDNNNDNNKCNFCTEIDMFNYGIIPIVTVNKVETDEKSKSLPDTRNSNEKEIPVYSPLPRPNKSHITNRNYSLIDIRTGLRKSRFTLELEDRLRKSKRKLGFDTHLSGWKEFTYTVGSPITDERPNASLDKGLQVKVNKFCRIDKDSVDDTKDATGYCTRNCQILGLCSVGRPQVFPNTSILEPPIYRDEMEMRYNMKNLIKAHPKKEGCPCDLCTLAFLTDMNFYDGRTVKVRRRSRSSRPSNKNSDSLFKEKIRITDKKFGNKSIEIKVRHVSPETRSSINSNFSNESSENNEDCTNSRIRKKFREHDFSEIKEIYNNPRSTYIECSVDELRPKEHLESDTCRPKVRRNSSTAFRNVSSKRGSRSFSSTTASFASSSSLSTVLSYKRVRQIFQTIIEGTRTNKKTRININKFKELEELGLGKLKNNRWYPSDYKTFAIWKDMNENVNGLQGDFKKYHKTAPKTENKILP